MKRLEIILQLIRGKITFFLIIILFQVKAFGVSYSDNCFHSPFNLHGVVTFGC